MKRIQSSCGDLESEISKIGQNPFSQLAGTGGGIRTSGTLIDVMCSRNKESRETFSRQEMKIWQENAGFDLGSMNSSYDADAVYKKSLAVIRGSKSPSRTHIALAVPSAPGSAVLGRLRRRPSLSNRKDQSVSHRSSCRAPSSI